jgi:hypothetical protein
MERMEAKEGVPICGRGRGKGRTRRADGDVTSQGNDPEPQYKPQREREEQVEGDDEKQVDVEPKAEQLDDYSGCPHVLTMYHVHVATMLVDEVVKRYTFI